MTRYVVVFVAWAAAVLCSAQVYPQSSSQNYKQRTSVADEAGGGASSANFRAKSSLGQPSAIGRSQSGSFKNYGGFLARPNSSASFQPISVFGAVKIDYKNNITKQTSEKPLRLLPVELYVDGLKMKTNIVTGVDGNFSFTAIPVTQNESEVHVKVILNSEIAHIYDTNIVGKRQTHSYQSQSLNAIVPGSSVRIDEMITDINEVYKAALIYQTISDAYYWFLGKVKIPPRSQINVEYPSELGNLFDYGGKYFHDGLFGEEIWISEDDDGDDKAEDRHAVLHEYSHAIMGAYYWIDDDVSGKHLPGTAFNAKFAFKEGWAFFLPAAIEYNVNVHLPVYGDDEIELANSNIEENEYYLGKTRNADKPSNNKGGAIVEGSVGSILWDIIDDETAVDDYDPKLDDFISDGIDDENVTIAFNSLWEVIKNYKVQTIIDFWQKWRIENSTHRSNQDIFQIYRSQDIELENSSSQILSSDVKGTNNEYADPVAALGPHDGNFVSLGVNGEIILDMGAGNEIADSDGNDVIVYEGNLASGGGTNSMQRSSTQQFAQADSIPEGFEFYASRDGGSWVSLGSGIGTDEFDLSDGGLAVARYFRIVDDGDGDPNSQSPGYDLDAIEAITDIPSAIGDEMPEIPSQYSLKQNYPNPFNPETVIQYELPENVRVSLQIYNLLGQNIRTLVDELKTAGSHSITWNGRMDNDQMAPSGVYLYILTTREFVATRKLLFLK